MTKSLVIKDISEQEQERLKMFYNMGAKYAKCYKMGECFILLTLEKGREHLSISTPYRLPTWQEIKKARYELMSKDKNIVMLLPPDEKYINIHEFCFQLVEAKESGIADL